MSRGWHRLVPLSAVLTLVLLLSQPRPASSQQLVLDLLNLAENIIAAIEAVLIEANQILELTPVDEVIVAGGIAADMEALGEIIANAEGLSYDIGSLQSQITQLFGLSTAPDTRDGLTERLAEIKQVKYQCYSYAAKVQTLLRTAIRTIEHLQGLLDGIGGLVGNMQGNRALHQAVLYQGVGA
jgi:conjugal transfer/entry exclusion protein